MAGSVGTFSLYLLIPPSQTGSRKCKIDFVLEILQELGNIPEAFQTRIQPEKDLQALTKVIKNKLKRCFVGVKLL